MRGLMKMLAAAFAAVRTVWTKCGETGKWIARTVAGGSGAAAAEYGHDDIVEPGPDAGIGHIRSLAAAIASGQVRPEQLETVSEQVFEWLSVMDRSQVAKLLMADDAAIQAHMRGTRSIRGVPAADQASVAEYRRALQREVRHDDEPGMETEAGLAFA